MTQIDGTQAQLFKTYENSFFTSQGRRPPPSTVLSTLPTTAFLSKPTYFRGFLLSGRPQVRGYGFVKHESEDFTLNVLSLVDQDAYVIDCEKFSSLFRSSATFMLRFSTRLRLESIPNIELVSNSQFYEWKILGTTQRPVSKPSSLELTESIGWSNGRNIKLVTAVGYKVLEIDGVTWMSVSHQRWTYLNVILT